MLGGGGGREVTMPKFQKKKDATRVCEMGDMGHPVNTGQLYW